jgi:hypothetical protein
MNKPDPTRVFVALIHVIGGIAVAWIRYRHQALPTAPFFRHPHADRVGARLTGLAAFWSAPYS